jgi:hypothetical protein
MSNAARQAKRAGARESSGNGTTAGLPCLPVLEPSEKAIKEIFASKKDREGLGEKSRAATRSFQKGK